MPQTKQQKKQYPRLHSTRSPYVSLYVRSSRSSVVRVRGLHDCSPYCTTSQRVSNPSSHSGGRKWTIDQEPTLPQRIRRQGRRPLQRFRVVWSIKQKNRHRKTQTTHKNTNTQEHTWDPQAQASTTTAKTNQTTRRGDGQERQTCRRRPSRRRTRTRPRLHTERSKPSPRTRLREQSAVAVDRFAADTTYSH